MQLPILLRVTNHQRTRIVSYSKRPARRATSTQPCRNLGHLGLRLDSFSFSQRPALLLATRAAAVLAILTLFPLFLLFLFLLQFFRFPLLPPRAMALHERLVLRCCHFKKIFLRRRIALRRGKRTL